MPTIYLSPSAQENNLYVSGGTEEQYMNLLADAMLPYLDASGIRYIRNTPDMTAAEAIAASNSGSYDLHVALHSNAAPEDRYGSVQGSIVFYYPGSIEGRAAARSMANCLKVIYPDPNLVRAEAASAIGELRRVRAPSVFLELAFHDNRADAAWIKENIPLIARTLVLSLTEYFSIPFYSSRMDQTAVVDVEQGSVNIRARPGKSAPVVARVPDGSPLLAVNRSGGWYLVEYGDVVGYAAEEYLTLT